MTNGETSVFVEERPSVLVVDDEPRILDSIRDLLGENFDVVATSDPLAALEILSEAQFAVILADQRMPGLTGDQFLMRAQNLSDATRILVTGYTDIDALIRAVNDGQIHTYVPKPWEPAQLRVTVLKAADHCRETLRRKQAASRLAEQQAALGRSEAAFRQQTKVLQSILDSMGDGVLVVDENGKMVLLNPAAEAMVGRAAFETPHSEWSESIGIYRPGTGTLYPPDELPLSRAMRGETEDGVELHIRNPLHPGDVFVSVNLRPLKDDDGRSRGGVAVAHDITGRRRTQELLQRAKEEAERANRAKSEFLSRMSHELRTPLNSILGFAQLLEMASLPPDDADAVSQILKGGRHLLSLINEVLDVARIEAGRLSLSPEPVYLPEVIQEALDLVRPLAQERSITIAGLSGDSDFWVKADRQRLRQVLLNLLANGVKYNVDSGRIVVAVNPNGYGAVRTSVSDTGPGIAAEEREKLFLPFERLTGESLAVEGTGLGLALSKGLVEAMGGVIGVDSTVGEGSTFWFDLMATESPAALHPELESLLTADSGEIAARSLIVLYIEDNPSNMALMKRIAETRQGVQLIGAPQGRLGLDLARVHRPDLILLDLHLPDMSGHEVLEQLRRDPDTKTVPVVIVSADATPEQMDRLLDSGAQSYVTKPIDIASMLRLLDSVLEDGARGTDDRFLSSVIELP
jgi:signal transduction histidine kinase/response regulator RpfG family c-di-GMP phosphodiesterase